MSRALILSVDGKAGHERQAVGVARRLFPHEVLRLPRHGAREIAVDTDGIALVLAAGRQAIAPARRLLRRSPRPVIAVLQPVVWHPSAFDLVWTPAHDRRSRGRLPENRIETLTAPSPLDAAECRKAAAQCQDLFAPLPAPRVGVLVGGPTRMHRFGRLEADEFAARLAAFSATHDASVLVATSPRTTPAIVKGLEERLAGIPHVLFDYRTTPDPSLAYAAVLGASAALIATGDSFAMMSEAVSTGKPVYGWRLPGGKAKFEAFYSALEAHGAMRWFDGRFDNWRYPPLDAAETIAGRLAPMLGLLTVPPART